MKKFRFLFWIIVSLLIIVSSNDAIAQRQGVVKGVVSDNQSKKPLPFANIGVKGTSFGTTADDEGKFSISLTAGNHTLSFSYLGYNTVVREVELDNEEVDLKDIKLNGNNSIEVSKDFTELHIFGK